MSMYRVDVYVPMSHVEQLKEAMFEAGGGKIGNYDRCCFQTKGTGQFHALEGATPFLDGSETVEEIKLEMVCDSSRLPFVLGAIKKVHPYETPAYQFWKVNVNE